MVRNDNEMDCSRALSTITSIQKPFIIGCTFQDHVERHV